MNTYVKVLIYSTIVGIVHVIYTHLQPPCLGEGLGCVADALGPLFFGLIVVPIVFGVLGFILSKEKRFLRALSWLAISFAVILTLNFVVGQIIKTTYPEPTPVYTPCDPNYIGNYTCEEWQKNQYQPL